MVKHTKEPALILALLLLAVQAAFAASFTATVDRTQVAPGESFNLNLSLSDASPSGSPDFSPLEDDFTIYSQGESHQTTIINTQISTSINWQLVLIPKRSGNLTIPAVSVQTDSGVLRSEPVDISVTKSAGITRNGGDDINQALLVTTEVSKTEPFQNEPLLYTVKLIARKNVRDVSIPEFNVDGAVVEKQGDAKIYDSVLNGQPAKVVELRYLITPLKSGTIDIPAYVFQGKVLSDRRQDDYFSRRMRDEFGKFDDFDNFPGFASFEPFALSGQEITLDVKPPAASMDHWLPLTSLSISDDLEGADGAKVGEPLTRKLKLVAEGASAVALPVLESSIAPDGSFRVYADKPSSGDKISADGSTITGWREESYTLIPQKSGAFTLPEIKVPWWDVNNNRIEYATVPARTINVAPGQNLTVADTGQASQSQPQQGDTAGQTKPGSVSEPTGIEAAQTWLSQPRFLYVILGALVLAVLVLAIVIIYLLRRLSRENLRGAFDRDGTQPYSAQGRLSEGDLNKIHSPEDLRNFLGTYATQHWDAPRNASLRTILAILAARGLQNELPEIKQAFSDLDTALYAGGSADIEDMKKRIGGILKAADKMKPSPEKQRADMRGLNPT